MSILFADSVGSSPNFDGKYFSEALREISEPWNPNDRVKSAIARAARVCGLSYWRGFDIWYCKARRIDAHEADQITQALRLKREKETRDEYHALKAALARIESRLVASGDPHFHRADIDFARDHLRGPGPVGRPVDRKR